MNFKTKMNNLIFLKFLFSFICGVLSTNIHQFCEISKEVYLTKISNIIVVENFKQIPTISFNNKCLRNISNVIQFNIREKHEKIIKLNFDFKTLSDLSWKIDRSDALTILFTQASGLEISDRIGKKNFTSKIRSSKFSLTFVESKIIFYYENKTIESCSQMKDKNLISIFNKINLKQVIFDRSRKFAKICPLIFQNLSIDMLLFRPLIDTFYLSTKTVYDILPDSKDLNVQINGLVFRDCVRIKLNKQLLNIHLFKNIVTLEILGNIELIEDNLFKSFKKIKTINFDGQNFRQQAHRTQLKWVKSINSNIQIDPKNLTQMYQNLHLLRRINLFFKDPAYFDYENFHRSIDLNNTFPEEDFCLYKDLPFDQMVFFVFDEFHYDAIIYPPMTCTLVWLVHNGILLTLYDLSMERGSEYFEQLLKKSRLMEIYEKCNFPFKIQKCSLNNIRKTIKRNTVAELQFYNFLFMYILDFFNIPITCLFGMLINIFSMVTISKIDKKENPHTLKQFYYMNINALFNFLICFVEFFRLIYTWPNTTGNGIWHLVPSQYFKIIFHEYLLNCFKFCSNLTFIMFSVFRIILINNTQSYSSFLFRLNPKIICNCIFLFSLFLFSIKLYSYDINYFNPFFDYPSHKNFDYLLIKNRKGEIVINLLNLICDFINYVLFSIIHLAVDLILIKSISENLKKKRNNLSRRQFSKFENIHLKSLFMTILNTTFNFILKLPAMSEFLFWNRKIIGLMLHKSKHMSNFLFFLINVDRSFLIHVIVILSIFMNLVSLSLNFVMMFLFNNIFRKAFKNYFLKLKN